MAEELLILDWDSAFFGFSVASFHCSSVSLDLLSDLQKRMKQLDIVLTYIFESKPILENIEKSSYKPLDTKVWYEKELELKDINSLQLTSIKGTYPTQDLKQMAYESGVFSRFRLDPKIEPHKARELYELWLEQSLLGSKAWEVLITEQNNRASGFVSLEEYEEGAKLGLLAVSNEFRRQGIGKQLVQGAINASWSHGSKKLQIITQDQNIPACKLYETFNFKRIKIENVYHLWSNSSIT